MSSAYTPIICGEKATVQHTKIRTKNLGTGSQ